MWKRFKIVRSANKKGVNKGMKKRWYRNSGVKALLVILAVTSLTASAVCGAAAGWLLKSGIWVGDSSEYKESKSFADDVFMRSHKILNSLESVKFLKDSTEEDLVDIKELDAEGIISDKNSSGLAYRLGDLIKWSRGSWDSAANVLICRKPDGSDYYMYYQDFADKIKSGELKLKYAGDNDYGLNREEILTELLCGNYTEYTDEYFDRSGIQSVGVEAVVDKNEKTVYTNVWNYSSSGNNDAALREEYAPVGANSILEVVNSSKWEGGSLSDAYHLLYMALIRFSNAADAENILEEYAQGNTNLKYLFIDKKSNKVYSNTDKVTVSNYESYLKKIISEAEPYIIVYPDQEECEVNILNTADQSVSGWQEMIQNTTNTEADYIFAVSVDENFAVSDQLAANSSKYNKYRPWLIPCMAVSAGMLVLFLFCLVVLTIGAGRDNEDNEVHLNVVDRIYTEIAAVGITVTGVMGVTACMEMLNVTGHEIWNLMFMALGVVWFTVWFLTGWMSLVRRIKARSLWRDSLLRHIFVWGEKLIRWLGSFVEMFSQNLMSRVKMTLLFGVFVFAEFILHGIGLAGDTPFALLILMVLDAVVLYGLLKKAWGRELIIEGLKKITDGDLQYKIPTEKLTGEQKKIGEYINHIGEGLDAAVEDSIKNERMKTELITNVSHDLKTPLTSIINYVDLLKRENPTDPKIQNYIAVLEDKAQRLKTLTEDVVEASKASTGNISLELTELNFVELIHQVIGEFEEKFQEKNLTLVVHFDEEEAMICADGRRLWRVLENVFGNVTKYAMENTRVYAEVNVQKPEVRFSLKNISSQPLNITAEELTERFVRGDVSRNTEGSGLGLSIAQSLTELQGGEFKVYVDGDLFKVTIIFKMK